VDAVKMQQDVTACCHIHARDFQSTIVSQTGMTEVDQHNN